MSDQGSIQTGSPAFIRIVLHHGLPVKGGPGSGVLRRIVTENWKVLNITAPVFILVLWKQVHIFQGGTLVDGDGCGSGLGPPGSDDDRTITAFRTIKSGGRKAL